MIRTIGFHSTEGRFNSIQHRCIIFTYGDPLWSSIDYGTTDIKLARVHLEIVVGDRRVLVGSNNAIGSQQLNNSGLSWQHSHIDGRFASLLAIGTGRL